MNEKEIVLDTLNGLKASIANYARIITMCQDDKLRKTFQQLRDGDEKFHYDLYKLAEEKGYCEPAPQADQQEVMRVKSCCCG